MRQQQWQNDDPNLKDFARIGAHVYLRTTQGKDNGASSPGLIILCTWMGATSRPIAKYAAGLSTRFPDSAILLIRSALEDFMVRSAAKQVERIRPAAEVVKETTEALSTNGQSPKVLLHIFSNGGSWSACMLKEAYARLTTDKLPISAMVIDSAPSLPHARQGHNAMMQCVPRPVLMRLIASCLIWIMIAVSYVMAKLRLSRSVILKLRHVLNDANGPFLSPAAPRTYICSKRDEMVPIEDVILHASEARMALETLGVHEEEQKVAVEEFVGSKHVGHMMVDSVRYWQIVQDTWDKVL